MWGRCVFQKDRAKSDITPTPLRTKWKHAFTCTCHSPYMYTILLSLDAPSFSIRSKSKGISILRITLAICNCVASDKQEGQWQKSSRDKQTTNRRRDVGHHACMNETMTMGIQCFPYFCQQRYTFFEACSVWIWSRGLFPLFDLSRWSLHFRCLHFQSFFEPVDFGLQTLKGRSQIHRLSLHVRTSRMASVRTHGVAYFLEWLQRPVFPPLPDMTYIPWRAQLALHLEARLRGLWGVFVLHTRYLFSMRQGSMVSLDFPRWPVRSYQQPNNQGETTGTFKTSERNLRFVCGGGRTTQQQLATESSAASWSTRLCSSDVLPQQPSSSSSPSAISSGLSFAPCAGDTACNRCSHHPQLQRISRCPFFCDKRRSVATSLCGCVPHDTTQHRRPSQGSGSGSGSGSG